jgi:RNA polymerase sigma-70 factor (ECF subfamily)
MSDFRHFSDAELTDLLKSGDQAAYTEIFERYHKLLLSHAYKLLRDRDEAHDVVQEVLLTLWQKHDTLRLSGSLSAYLYIAVKNRIFNLMSHEKVVARYADSLNAFLDSGAAPADHQLIGKELAALIEKEIGQLPPKMREIFLLRREEELDYDAIGEQLHISGNAAKQQVYNAVKILKLKISSLLTLLL